MKTEVILGILIAAIGGLAVLLITSGSGAINVVDGEIVVRQNGKCSIREAIENANDTKTGKVHGDCKAGDPTGADTIRLKANSLYLFADAPFEEQGFNALPLITSEITIDGRNAVFERDRALECDWIDEQPTKPFRFLFLTNEAVLTIQNVTMTNGCTLGSSFDKDGGAIFNNIGTLMIENSTFSQNFAQRNGGAIYSNRAAELSVQNSRITDNEAQYGGAIYSNGAARFEIMYSKIERNIASTSGGGIYNVEGSLYVTESEISANTAKLYGGALFSSRSESLIESSSLMGNATNDSGGAIYNDIIGNLLVINSNISFNSTRTFGAAIYNYLNGNIGIMNSTFTQNAAPSGVILNTGQAQISFSTITQNSASGITNFGEAAITAVANSIIALNKTQTDCQISSGTIQAIGQNIDTDGSCRALSNGGIFVTADPLLDPAGLQSNGGPTMTIALLPGSPAIDAIPDCGVPIDQRGVERPQGETCDVGAYEFASEPEASLDDAD